MALLLRCTVYTVYKVLTAPQILTPMIPGLSSNIKKSEWPMGRPKYRVSYSSSAVAAPGVPPFGRTTITDSPWSSILIHRTALKYPTTINLAEKWFRRSLLGVVGYS